MSIVLNHSRCDRCDAPIVLRIGRVSDGAGAAGLTSARCLKGHADVVISDAR